MLILLGLLPLTPPAIRDAGAQVLRFDSEASWQQWQLPAGALEITPSGGLVAVRLRKDINAAVNSAQFDGGVLQASSNRQMADLAIDGDPATGWRPDGTERTGEAVLEINLGRAVSTNSVTLVFAEDAPPFELFEVLMSTGEPQVDIVGNPLPGVVVYRMQHRFKENSRHEVTIEFDPLKDPPIQYVRVVPLIYHPDARLTEIQVNGFGDNAVLGLIPRGGSANVVVGLGRIELDVPLGNVVGLIDGAMATRMYYGATPGRGVEDIDAHIVLDLGAVYWLDHVRLIGEAMGFRRFSFKDYSLLTSDGSLAPDGTLIWDRQFNGRATDSDNRRGFVDHFFQRRPVRLVRLLWKFWDGACAVALGGGQRATSVACSARGTMQEMQAFGGGFPRDLRMQSQILDLGQRRNFSIVEWQGEVPAGTRLEIRSRTGGGLVERYVFLDRNGKQVTERAWGRLIPSFRGPIDTLQSVGGDWSPWSTAYARSGDRFLSPAPRRYAQLQVGLLTDDPEVAPSLDWLQVTHTSPLALTAVCEVFPTQVRVGVEQEFSYFVRTDNSSAGFDALAVEATAPPTFLEAHMSGEPVEAAAKVTTDGFRVTLPRRARGGELVELRFSSAVFLHGTRFEAFLEDSRSPGDRQRVDAGDASPDVPGNTNVVGLPVGERVLANVTLSTPVVTPNGDAVNDELRVEVDVANLLVARPLVLRVFDLGGRIVHQQQRHIEAGRERISWQARGVAPGVYVVELSVAGDARSETVRRTVAVVY